MVRHFEGVLKCSPTLTDSLEDDFELSAVCHRPEDLEKLQELTRFTKKELQVLYRGFKNVSISSTLSPLCISTEAMMAIPGSVTLCHVPRRSVPAEWLTRTPSSSSTPSFSLRVVSVP